LNDTSQRLDSAAAQSPREEDLDREAAIWVLSLGGTVKVFPCDDDVKIAEVKDLPAPPFQLQYVMLGDNPRVNDAGLARLKGLGRLDTLQLFKTPVTDAGLVHLRDLKTLKVLYLSYTQVGDDGLLHLRELENLTLLSLYGTQVSDAGLAHLTSLKKLTQLNLSGTQVSDLGLPTLYALANLREVGLRDTLATAGGVAALQKALPSCRIIWSDSDTEPR
jgi:hypothetical protein